MKSLENKSMIRLIIIGIGVVFLMYLFSCDGIAAGLNEERHHRYLDNVRESNQEHMRQMERRNEKERDRRIDRLQRIEDARQERQVERERRSRDR
jgi:hypothetical protein